MDERAADPSVVPELVPPPSSGRVFVANDMTARVADVHFAWRSRLDGIARYLQDLFTDDTIDSRVSGRDDWVVRRTVVQVLGFPRYLERLSLKTWCSALGGHFAERRAQIFGSGVGHIEAASLWVSVDPATGRPRRMADDFLATYQEAAGGRTIRARLVLPEPHEGFVPRPWVVRVADLDPWRHVNNAVSWAVLEEAAGEAGMVLVPPVLAEVEHRRPILPSADVTWGWWLDPETGALLVWLLADGVVASAGRIRLLPAPPGDDD